MKLTALLGAIALASFAQAAAAQWQPVGTLDSDPGLLDMQNCAYRVSIAGSAGSRYFMAVSRVWERTLEGGTRAYQQVVSLEATGAEPFYELLSADAKQALANHFNYPNSVQAPFEARVAVGYEFGGVFLNYRYFDRNTSGVIAVNVKLDSSRIELQRQCAATYRVVPRR
jgi:opacity protein-like surface antigen